MLTLLEKKIPGLMPKRSVLRDDPEIRCDESMDFHHTMKTQHIFRALIILFKKCVLEWNLGFQHFHP